jgi:hypothetical protein
VLHAPQLPPHRHVYVLEERLVLDFSVKHHFHCIVEQQECEAQMRNPPNRHEPTRFFDLDRYEFQLDHPPRMPRRLPASSWSAPALLHFAVSGSSVVRPGVPEPTYPVWLVNR